MLERNDAIRPLYHIPSKEIHNSNPSLIDGTFDSAVVGPFSGQKRGLSQNGPSDGLRPRTMTRLVPADSSRQGDSVDINFF